MSRFPTLGSALDAHGGVGPSFDIVRLVLAASVIVLHSFTLVAANQEFVRDTPAWILAYLIVPSFIAVSGFLVAGSAQRLPPLQFAISRAFRILPALMVVTALSILVLGPIVTSLPLGEYLTHPETLRYWLNGVAFTSYALPGVFQELPNQAVNGSLWSIKPELMCYGVMICLVLTGLLNRWPVIVLAILGMFTLSVGAAIGVDFPGRGVVGSAIFKLLPFFLIGALLYLLRYRIPMTPWLLPTPLVFIAVCMAFGSNEWWTSPLFELPAAVLLSYLVIRLGMADVPKIPLPDKGDFSYGTYVYAFPIQQAVIYLTGTRDPWAVLALTIIPVAICAAGSWYLVEKPAIEFRKRLSAGSGQHRKRRLVTNRPVDDTAGV